MLASIVTKKASEFMAASMAKSIESYIDGQSLKVQNYIRFNEQYFVITQTTFKSVNKKLFLIL